MKIITNNIPRPLACFLDLPEKIRQDFDYIDDSYDLRFVQYKSVWYDVWDSMNCPWFEAPAATRHAFSGWDGYISDSYFSGVLFKFADEDCVVCATYTC